MLNPSELNIEEEVAEAVNRITPTIRKRQQTIEVNIAKGLPTMRTDDKRLQQVLPNLLSNAAKFTPVEGTISISASRSGDGVSISVTDSGIGIREEDQGRIFEEFVQLEQMDKTQKNSGLGLALSRKLIWLMGGKIWFQSTYGLGSVFSFSLPAA